MNELRPMALGEIVDRSASFWRTHWKALFQLFLGFQLVQYLVLKLWQLGLSRWFPAARGGGRMLELVQSDPAKAMLQVGVGVVSAGVVMLITFLVSLLAGVAATWFVYPRVLGQPGPSLTESLQRARARAGVTAGAFFLSVGWGAVVALGFHLPGLALIGATAVAAVEGGKAVAALLGMLGLLVLAAGSLVTFLWFIIRFVMTAQVAALEDGGPMRVFRRTDELSSGRVAPGFAGWVKGRLTVLITVMGAILLLVSLVTGLPQMALQVVYGNVFDPTHANPDAVPAALLVPAELLQIVVGSIFSPLYVVFQVMFYVDMQVRREGLDLKLKLDAPA